MSNFGQKQNRQLLLMRFGGLSLIVLSVIAVASWGLYSTLYHQELNQLKADSERNLELGEFYLAKELQGLTSDLELIASSSILKEYLQSPSPKARQNVESRISDFVNYRRRYDQIRVLDLTGQEEIRVNYYSGKAVVIPEEQLQSKADRYYFQQAISLPLGVFYVSPLDLNIENQEIETPYKPMIRVAIKVADETGRAAGVLVLNYLAETMIRGLKDIYPEGPGQLLLVNRAGYYLKGPSADLEWGFMLTTRKQHSLPNESPEVWRQIENSPSGFLINDHTILGYRSLNPANLLINSNLQNVAPQSVSRRWTLLTLLPAEALTSTMAPHIQALGLGATLMVCFSIVGAFLYTRTTLHRDEYNRQAKQLVAALEKSPLGIAIANLDGIVEYANLSIFRITGLLSQQVLEQPLWCLDKKRLPSALREQVNAAIAERESWQGRYQSSRGENKTTDEELMISWLERTKDDPPKMIIILRDVTHEMELESQLRQAQKMEAVGQLAAGVAHDFNNLLQIILGSTTLINRRLQPEGKIAAMLDGILQAAEKGATLTRQLLTFSKSKPLSSEAISPDELIISTLKMIRWLLGEQIVVENYSAGNGCFLLADPGMLEQALINLCLNARDAMPTGGTLTIRSTAITAQEAHETLADKAADSYWYRLSVTDNGDGIPENLLDRVFEPFFTTKETGKGTGLGLATVYAIVNRHGGRITVSSTLGAGTTFDLYLPVCSADVCMNVQPHPETTELISGHGEVILLAEDDDQVRNFAGSLLEDAGYKVVLAEDGAAAIRKYDQQQNEINLILLDVIMPVKNGRQVYEHIRGKDAEIPVLFASGHDFNILKGIGLNDTEQEVISKPYTPDLLLKKVSEKLASHASRG